MESKLSNPGILSDDDIETLGRRMLGTLRGREKQRRTRHLVAAGASILLAAGLTTAATIAFWPTNDVGQTYGPADDRVVDPSNPLPVIEPDLILVDGGGYVKSTDLNPIFHSPEEATAFQAEHPPTEDREIPLYDKDGNVIGTFTITGVTDVMEGEESERWVEEHQR